MKIALYCRVSTQEQGKKNTIETQITQLKERYKDPVEVYTDISSGSYLQREGLNQLRKDAKKGLFDTIAVYSLDRLSRKLGHQIALIEEFEKQGIKIEVLGR
jgi:site-specific DNA recombinase